MTPFVFDGTGIPDFAVELMAVPFGIGRFVIEWSQHERKIARLEAHARNTEYADVRDRLLRGPTSGYQKIAEKMRSDFAEHPHIASKLDELIEKQAISIENRHHIVHGFWEGRDDDGHYIKRTMRDGSHLVRHFSGIELLKLADDVHDLGSIVMRLENDLSILRGEALRWSGFE